MSVSLANPNVITRPIAPGIIASIQEQKKERISKAIDVLSSQPLNPKELKEKQLAELRYPSKSSDRLLKQPPSFTKMISLLKDSFLGLQTQYIREMERFYPRMTKTMVCYELIEHFSRGISSYSLPKKNVVVGGEKFEVLDGSHLDLPVFFHETLTRQVLDILSDPEKFYSDEVKFTLSLYEDGMPFFSAANPNYVSIGFAIDPKNFYRNHYSITFIPMYNKQTDDEKALYRVREHVWDGRCVRLIAAHIDSLLARVYSHHKHRNTVASLREKVVDRDYASAYSDSDRLCRLHKTVVENRFFFQSKGFCVTEQERLDREREVAVRRKETKEMQQEQQILLQKTGHSNPNSFFGPNIGHKISELLHLADKLKDRSLRAAIDEVKQLEVTEVGDCQFGRLADFLRPREILQVAELYNEFEAVSHEWGKEQSARPLEIKFFMMSDAAFCDILNGVNEESVETFKAFAKAARKKNLPILIVSTAGKKNQLDSLKDQPRLKKV